MGNIEKQLRGIPDNDRERVFIAMERIVTRDFSSLDRKRLQGHKTAFRVRVGNYRIIYLDDGVNIVFKGVRKRDERTYKAF